MTMKIKPLTESYAVSPQLRVHNVAAAAAQGYKTLINNRPDGEGWGQPKSADIEVEARRHGLAYHHLPISLRGLAPGQIEAAAAILENAEDPVLGFCKSGTRAAHIWALTQAGRMAVDEIIAAAASAGYDVRALRACLG